MDIGMINAWTQVKSYHGHFERSQTFSFAKSVVKNGTAKTNNTSMPSTKSHLTFTSLHNYF